MNRKDQEIQRRIKAAQLESAPILGATEGQTLGLYAAGKCPECRLMVFYHGAQGMDPVIYTCCGRDCNHKMELQVPPGYQAKMERTSCNYVFGLIDHLQKGLPLFDNGDNSGHETPAGDSGETGEGVRGTLPGGVGEEDGGVPSPEGEVGVEDRGLSGNDRD